MNQSKPNSQSDDEYVYWFTKNNYMSNYLDERSRKIIEKLKNKKEY